MNSIQAAQSAPLTKAGYLAFRNRYVPAKVRTIFVLESPPTSGKYFYNPDGKTSEPLFRAMMKDVLGIASNSKEEGLKQFAARGYLVIDATYTPVNRFTDRQKEAAILANFPHLISELRRYKGSQTGIVLVQANVCRLLEPKLRESGFNVLNRGKVIPFPSSGQQNKFGVAVRKVFQGK